MSASADCAMCDPLGLQSQVRLLIDRIHVGLGSKVCEPTCFDHGLGSVCANVGCMIFAARTQTVGRVGAVQGAPATGVFAPQHTMPQCFIVAPFALEACAVGTVSVCLFVYGGSTDAQSIVSE